MGSYLPPAVNVTNPDGGLDISTTPYPGTGIGDGYGRGLLGQYTKAFMDRALARADEAKHDRENARARESEVLDDPLRKQAEAYKLQQLRDETELENQRARGVPLKTISGPQITPGLVPDKNQLLLGNAPKSGGFSANPAGVSSAPTGSITPANPDDMARRKKEIQMSALASLQDRLNSTGDVLGSAPGSYQTPAGG